MCLWVGGQDIFKIKEGNGFNWNTVDLSPLIINFASQNTSITVASNGQKLADYFVLWRVGIDYVCYTNAGYICIEELTFPTAGQPFSKLTVVTQPLNAIKHTV